MKLKRVLAISSFVATTSFVLPVVSCSKDNDQTTTFVNQLKDNLDSIIDKNLNVLNKSLVSVRNDVDTKSYNLFKILNGENDLSVFFDINTSNLNYDRDKYDLSIEFTYNIVDSYGETFEPLLSSNQKTINIPVLVWIYDKELKLSITKYINLFSLSIEDSIIDDSEIEDYYQNEAKKIVFKSFDNTTYEFQSVPSLMIDKYLDFITIISSSKDWMKGPKYKSSSSDLEDWKGKTLSEVYSISGAISSPTDFVWPQDTSYKFTYSISDAYFYDKDWNYGTFIMSFQLSSNNFGTLLNDAKTIYGLSFSKEYSFVSKQWSFASPSSSDISDYVDNNEKKLTTFIDEEVTNNIMLYTPKFVWNNHIIKEWKVDEIIKAFNNGAKIFDAPRPIVYKLSNGQTRNIRFVIDSLSAGDNENLIVVSVKAIIDNGKLEASKTYSKTFNKLTLEFE